jgi:hypothetical protein
MYQWHRVSIALVACTAFASFSLTALAEQGEPADPSPAPGPAAPPDDPLFPASPETGADPAATAEAEAGEDEAKAKEPGRGDFDAGGRVRLPNGPDENGEFATFTWITLDLVGRYFLLDTVTINGNIPLAVKKPGMLQSGEDPKLIGGIQASLEARLPWLPFQPKKYETDIGLVLTGAYMREGAMLLSEKDFPLFDGDFKPGLSAGTIAKIKLSSLFAFSLTPVFVYQSGSEESLTAIQVPTSTILKLGSLVKLSADLGVFTGDDYSLRGRNGGRIAAGGSLTVKLGPILAHAGAGAASLLTGGLYPTVSDSLYIDLNVKYAK